MGLFCIETINKEAVAHRAENIWMFDEPQNPRVVDLSFEHESRQTHFTITEFANSDLVIISDVGRIGQVVQVGC